jgi:D-3-phosphoglycerate dehydrogenase
VNNREVEMFRIQTLNRISTVGLDLLPRDRYEVASDLPNPDAILLRSYNMFDMQIPESLKAIARAGIGVNNIPVEVCTERGIVVFNTPGANANSVKELVLAGLLISSRGIFAGTNWAKSLAGKGDEIPSIVEKGKSRFAGPEIRGKKLGVIGLGAVGVMVANDAVSLGMEVTGYDPFISVESAWGLSRNVKRSMGLEALISESDYITIHVPLTEKTRGMINRNRFSIMKRGVRLLNFARGGLIKNDDLIEAINEGVVAGYVTDFPEEELLHIDKVTAIPHLGASTPEAEDNCALMAVGQLMDYLERGNIKDSTNFPTCEMAMSNNERIIIANRNIPNMVGQITTLLAKEMINISDMINKHKDGLAYNIIDVDQKITSETIQKIKEIEGVIMVRIIWFL